MEGYRQALREVEASGRSVPPGSFDESRGLARFAVLFSEPTEERIVSTAHEVYADDVYFNDTLKEIRGIDRLVPYLIDSARATQHCQVEIEDIASHGANYYVRWVMETRFGRLARGTLTRSIGMSHLRLDHDGKILLHQDYWDAASGLFEHVPLLGWGIRRIKQRV